jgi:hypothetical protein
MHLNLDGHVLTKWDEMNLRDGWRCRRDGKKSLTDGEKRLTDDEKRLSDDERRDGRTHHHSTRNGYLREKRLGRH